MKMNKFEKWIVNSKGHAQNNIKILEDLLHRTEVGQVNKVLEIGCGAGAMASYLSKNYNCTVTGTDVDAEQIDLARRHYNENEKLQFMKSDAISLPFGHNEFDLVLSFKVLHHIRDWQRALAEVARVLKPNGFYIFNDIAVPEYSARILRTLLKKYGVYTADEIADNLGRNGFSRVYATNPRGILMNKLTLVLQK